MLCVSRISTTHPVNGKQDPHSFANEARELSLVENSRANDTQRDTVKTDGSLMSEGAKTKTNFECFLLCGSKEGRVTKRRCSWGRSLSY